MLKEARMSKGKWQAYDQEKAKLELQIVQAIKQAKLKPVECCSIHYCWVEPNRKRDPRNVAAGAKYIEDALVEAGILPNDGWAHILGFRDRWYVDRQHPGVSVTIKEEGEP